MGLAAFPTGLARVFRPVILAILVLGGFALYMLFDWWGVAAALAAATAVAIFI